MANTSRKLLILAAVAIVLVAALYLTGLTRMGMYSTDEPRYADIGCTMAQTGDWVTPRLWGQPWFEKPALLYWMTAIGFTLGLSQDLAPRLPVALLSVAFLCCFRRRLVRLFDSETANIATAMLATSAGWLAYSHVAVTDLPLSAFFTLAVIWSLPAKEEASPPRWAAAAALGLAVLAKSVPPLVLFLPVIVLDLCNWRRWFASWPIVVFAAVALPWHVMGTIRNGAHFLYVLFVQQQFGRYFSDVLQHTQPWWFYAPVFMVLLFPWFPLLPLAVRHLKEDARLRTLAAVAGFGLVFFSVSVNKLPGYVLPLVPSTCALMAYAVTRAKRRERWLVAPIALLGTLPVVASVMPESVVHLRAAQIPWNALLTGFAVAAFGGCAVALRFRRVALEVAVLLATAGFVWVEIDLFPVLDRAESARSLWIGNHPGCAPVLPRGMTYSLYYYSGKALPDCAIVDKKAIEIRASGPTQ